MSDFVVKCQHTKSTDNWVIDHEKEYPGETKEQILQRVAQWNRAEANYKQEFVYSVEDK